MSWPQLHKGFIISWKLCLNLCSLKWLRPNLSLVISLNPLGLWQSKKEFGEGRMKLNIFSLTLFVPGVRRSAHPYGKLPGAWAILPQGPCASLTFNNFFGRLRLLNQSFENSAFCGHTWITVKPTVSNRKIPLYVTYLYPRRFK